MISVIVPVYNGEKTLGRCIESICCQTCTDLEIILVDDGSEDASLRICDCYAEKDRRIHIIRQKNKGPVAARKAGLNLAAGKYIGFVDADDYVEPNMYTVLLQEIEIYQADLAQIRADYENNKSKEIIDIEENSIVSTLNQKLFLEDRISANLWSKLFRTQMIKEVFEMIPDDLWYGEDLLCIIHYLRKCHRIVITNNTCYNYTYLKGSLSNREIDTMILEASHLYEYIRKALQGYGIWDECHMAAQSYYFNNLLAFFGREYPGESIISRYRFSKIEDIRGKRIVVYGAGSVGKDYYKQFAVDPECELVGWVDKKAIGGKILSPQRLNDLGFDVIVIGVLDEQIVDEIKKELTTDMKIDVKQIVWEKPEKLWGKRKNDVPKRI